MKTHIARPTLNYWIWDWETEVLVRELRGHRARTVDSIAWYPGNERIFTTCWMITRYKSRGTEVVEQEPRGTRSQLSYRLTVRVPLTR
ncbi:hypothetical protein P691DRAFT_668633 [Macrolepiota fuliginosa MF-IS2]|uniref:Uncharacterized protein n=1 Tax=Macrolepiota fuliginosa MF-IS2 TaxID=1400762 RepID=A0A9P5XDV2_9AGAR|nr:hypothetical protein P691DRAFT_668633 [Macrolepiota fuliginosa MF-IS2]